MMRLPQNHHNLSTFNPPSPLTIWKTVPTPNPSLFNLKMTQHIRPNLSTSTPPPFTIGTFPQKTDPTPTPSLLNKSTNLAPFTIITTSVEYHHKNC